MKTDKTAAEASNTPFVAAQSLFSHMQQSGSAWTKIARDQVDACEKVLGELADVQQHGLRRVDAATDEFGKLVKASFGYAGALADQLRSASVDAARRSLELFSPES